METSEFESSVMENKARVFHVNKRKKINDFVNSKILSTSIEDGEWFGNGMYFWDNKPNCMFWIRNRKYKENKIDYKVVQSSIEYDDSDIIDFTNDDDVVYFEKLEKIIASDLNLTDAEIIQMGKELGYSINVCLENMEQMPSGAPSLIKGFAHYPSTPKIYQFSKKHFALTKYNHRALPTRDIKVIYCVKDKKVLNFNDTDIIDLEEREV